jgi:hypothetical protein
MPPPKFRPRRASSRRTAAPKDRVAGKPADRPVYKVAPVAAADSPGGFSMPADWPSQPPAWRGGPAKPPVFRPLKVYAFGPSLGRAPGNVRSIDVRYEKLQPGPVGERIAVVDYDSSRDCFYEPVDLDDPLIAINGGLDPSESDPRFHQQMVYAVASETLRRVEVAIGRTVLRRSPAGATPLRLIIYPHGEVATNSYTIEGRIVLGYFEAGKTATGRTLPGQTIFTCLSHDVIVHEAAVAILGAMRPDFETGNYLDTLAFQMMMSDLTSLLFHFTHREVVLDTIRRTAGVIYRSQLESDRDPGSQPPRILAELAANNPLLALSQDFGEALGQATGLRNALIAPDAKAFEHTLQPHARGAIVVAAFFDALFSIYQRRTLDLFRIHRAGGGRLGDTDVPEPLAARLCDEVERIAARVFNMCWRALDYCPPHNITLGDVLRACITADYEYTREDRWALRDAMMQAFRLRGIKASTASFYSEDTLRWPLVDTSGWKQERLDPAKLSGEEAGAELHRFVDRNARALGFPRKTGLSIYPLDVARLTAPDDTPQTTWSTQVVSKGRGVTLVFDGVGRLRYAIPTSAKPASETAREAADATPPPA